MKTKFRWLLYLNHSLLAVGFMILSVRLFTSHAFLAVTAGIFALAVLITMKNVVKMMDAGRPHKRTVLIDILVFAGLISVFLLGGENNASPITFFLIAYVVIDLIYNMAKYLSHNKQSDLEKRRIDNL